MMWRAWLAGAAMVIGCATWYVWPSESEQPPVVPTPSAVTPTHTASPPLSLPVNWPPPLPYSADNPQRVPLPPLEPPVLAAQSMAEARENGDPRTPPISRDPEGLSAKPSSEELADPAAYQRFETRQNMRLLAAFTQAAAADLPKLRDDIVRGRAAGIAPEQIAKVEEKVRRIEEMRAKLLKDHPELAH